MIGVGLAFTKMSGHGNDFLFVDNREGKVGSAEMPFLTQAACRRQYGVGADGMVFIENGPAGVDFAWQFFNSDGSIAEMCGNTGRCAARYAYMNGIAPARMRFQTLAGVIGAEVFPDTVKIQMTKPGPADLDCVLNFNESEMTFCTINTGVPHAVTWVDDVESEKVVDTGRAVRFHPRYKPSGTNVNFVQPLSDNRLVLRTYERGVEDETLACGTGVVASVLLSSIKGLVVSPTRVLTRGGEELLVHFQRDGDEFIEVYLEGPVRVICTGLLGPDFMLN